jgi:hypothetical protein
VDALIIKAVVLHDESGKTLDQVFPLDLGQFYEQIWKKEFTSEGHVPWHVSYTKR